MAARDVVEAAVVADRPTDRPTSPSTKCMV
jgi:hypothetical protein